jgi:hypothetical protein
MKLQKNSPYSNLNVTWQFEFVLNQVLLVDSTSLAYSSADNGCSPQNQCISLPALWGKVILDDITSLDRTKKIMRNKKGITSMGLEKDNHEKKATKQKTQKKIVSQRTWPFNKLVCKLTKPLAMTTSWPENSKSTPVITIHLWILVNLSQLSSKSTIMLCL